MSPKPQLNNELLAALSGNYLPKSNGLNTRLEIVENKVEFIVENMFDSINTGLKEIKCVAHELASEVKSMKESQTRIEEEIKLSREERREIKSKIEDMTTAIYDPDIGIYRRINENYKRINDSVDSAKIREDKLDLVVSKIESIETVVRTEQTLKKIAGDNLEDLNAVIKAKRTINKLMVALVTSFIGAVGVAIYNWLS